MASLVRAVLSSSLRLLFAPSIFRFDSPLVGLLSFERRLRFVVVFAVLWLLAASTSAAHRTALLPLFFPGSVDVTSLLSVVWLDPTLCEGGGGGGIISSFLGRVLFGFFSLCDVALSYVDRKFSLAFHSP